MLDWLALVVMGVLALALLALVVLLYLRVAGAGVAAAYRRLRRSRLRRNGTPLIKDPRSWITAGTIAGVVVGAGLGAYGLVVLVLLVAALTWGIVEVRRDAEPKQPSTPRRTLNP